MRITEQILAVVDYGGEREDVMAFFDGMEEAQRGVVIYTLLGPITLCRVRIIEVMGVAEAQAPR